MANKYQTLSGFLLSPFHGKEDVEKDASYNSKYTAFVASNKIRLQAVCEIEDSYYLHIKVPSESQKNGNYEYDVVIRFFTDDPETLKQPHLRGYYIQFFSNSPSFMYQYAYLYNKEGFLIEALYDKLDAEYIDTPPEKTNSQMKTSYDKSIYFACRFLSEKKFRYLDKHGVLLSKKVNEKNFFSNISDFKSVKLDQSLMIEERKLSNILKQKAPSLRRKKEDNTNKKLASKSTSKGGITSINIIKKKGGKAKIVGRKTTRKR